MSDLSGAVVPVVMLVEMHFSTPVYVSSSSVDIDYDGKTWRGLGSLGSVEAIKDSAGSATGGLRLSLSGIPTEQISLALNESARNKPAAIHLAELDPVTHAISAVKTLWRGVMDQQPNSEGQGSSVVSITLLHRANLFRRPKVLRYTDGDQQKLFPGDTSLRFIVSQATHQDVWPAAAFFRQ